MKKILSAFIGLALVAIMAVSASAASGINDNERRVLDLLSSKTESGAFIPVNYVNQAENYFLQIDLTAEQADQIIGYMQHALDILNARKSVVAAAGGDTFNLKGLAYADKKAILEDGQKACAVIGLNLIFDGTNVVITDANDSSKVYFTNAPIIKVTGEETGRYTALIVGSAALILAAAAAGAVVLAREKVVAA